MFQRPDRPTTTIRTRMALVAVALSIAIALAAGAGNAAAAAPAGPPTWSDEFSGTSLDVSRWSHRATGPRNDGILTPDAVTVAGGALTIKTYTEQGKHYSGMISTQQHGSDGFEQTYGYFEAKVKFNSSPGQWSAFWLQSPTIASPLGDPAAAGVEMDVAEHRARCVTASAPTSPATCAPDRDITDRTQRALIWDGYGPDLKAAVKLSDPLPGLGNGSWHTWALRWTPTEVTFYYDDAAIWSQKGPISRRSQYMILSSEVGRFFAGDIPAAGYGPRETSTTSMKVAYVRVWDLAAATAAAPAALTPTVPANVGSGVPVVAAPQPQAKPVLLPVLDTTAPYALLSGSTSQKVDATVAVTIACPDEACRATTSATVRVPKVGRARARVFRPKAITATIAKGTRATVKLKLSGRARAAIRRALKARRRVVLKLGVRVADSAGNVRPQTRRVALRR
jgi:beta-glucanase (GH16 family)